MSKSKYRNRKVTYHGITFASQKEGNRYLALLDDQKRGIIKNLELQPKYKFVKNGYKICEYWGDFSYFKGDQFIVEDTKSPATRKNRAYRIKVKLMRAFYDIDVLET